MGSLTSAMEISNSKPKWVYPKSLGLTPPRWGHSACYFHGVLYIFGGCCGGLHFSDVLALNLTTMTWTTLATTGTGPGPRDSHSAIVVGQKIVILGGTDGTKKLNDLHILDLSSKEWYKPDCSGAPPTPRESHTSTLIGDDRMVVFGGSGEGEANYLNDLYVLDLKRMIWSSPEVTGEIPVPRDSHGSVAIGSRMYVYGGDCGNRYNGDIEVLDMCTMAWSRMSFQGSLPGVRAGHAMVNFDSKIYVVGGVGDKCYYNDVWVIDVVNNTWSKLEVHGQRPQGRFSHTAISTDSEIVIYGGCGEDERPLDELLILRLGAGYGKHNIFASKMSRGHCEVKRRFLTDIDSKPVLSRFGLKPSAPYSLDMLHSKRRRTNNSNIVEVETEREDSLQLTHNSFSSQSDHEQALSGKRVHELISQEFPIHKNRNCVTRNFVHELRKVSSPPSFRQDQFPHAQQRSLEAISSLNMVGSEVHGKVDAAFDSGYLITALVNGKIFRGVLFSPAPTVQLHGNPQGPSEIPVAVPILHYSNSYEAGAGHFKPTYPATENPLQSSHTSCTHPLIRNKTSSAVSVNTREKMRCDLQSVVLTLSAPGSSFNGST